MIISRQKIPFEVERGNRTAYIDNVYIYFVTDSTTRLNGLQSGEYDIAAGIAFTDYSTISANSDIQIFKSNWNSTTITMNKSMTQFKMIQNGDR